MSKFACFDARTWYIDDDLSWAFSVEKLIDVCDRCRELFRVIIFFLTSFSDCLIYHSIVVNQFNDFYRLFASECVSVSQSEAVWVNARQHRRFESHWAFQFSYHLLESLLWSISSFWAFSRLHTADDYSISFWNFSQKYSLIIQHR